MMAAGIVVVLLGSGCPSGDSVPEMTWAERRALECKANLQAIGDHLTAQYYGGAPISAEMVKDLPARVTTCPAAEDNTYQTSLEQALGKLPDEAVITCEGHHHEEVGWAPDFPRWTSDQGVQENAEGVTAAPPSLGLPVPADARFVRTQAKQGSALVVFATESDLEELARHYSELLNPGADFVQPFQNGELSVTGNLNHIAYSVTLRQDPGEVEVVYEPLMEPR